MVDGGMADGGPICLGDLCKRRGRWLSCPAAFCVEFDFIGATPHPLTPLPAESTTQIPDSWGARLEGPPPASVILGRRVDDRVDCGCRAAAMV